MSVSAAHPRALALLVLSSLIASALLACGVALSAERWLDKFLGEWAGTGTFAGNAAGYRLSWQPALGDKYVRLTVRYEWRTSAGETQRLEGEALYPAVATATARGDWFDSEGHHYATSAYSEDDTSIVVHWGEGGTRGRSQYQLRAGELEVTDAIWREPQGWRTFSQARLGRQ